MAEIPGATITFTDYSAPGTPRTLNIPDGAGDVTVQDVWDTLSACSAKLENLIYKKLVDRTRSGGKQEIGVGKFGGIVMTMYNAQIKFPDQAGPTTIRKKVVDGVPVANDAVEPAPSAIEALAISDFTFAETEKDISAALLASDAAAVATAVWEEDLAGYTTEGEAGDIQRRQAFGDGVWLEHGSAISGTAFPIGTRAQPVNNFTDAKAIAEANGLKKFWVLSGDGLGFTLPAIDFFGYEFEGVPWNTGALTLAAAQDYALCTFKYFFLLGGTMGAIKAWGGTTSPLVAAAGEFHETDIAGEFKCDAAASYFVSVIERCISRGQGAINANDKLAFVYVRRCGGQFTFRNFSVAGSVLDIDMTGGTVTLESTCTAGTITISGTCGVIDNSAGATVIDQTELSWMKKKLLTLAAYVGLK